MTSKPNILLITTDQQRFDTIAALGNPHIFTPHLDWLVDEGITFTRAYSDCPVCMPARATIMTGKHGFNSGLVTNGINAHPMQDFPTIPGILTQAGYQTRAQGKMHFHPTRANYGFEHMELPFEYYRECTRHPQEGLPKQHGVGENEMTPVISTVDEAHSLTHWTVQRSIDFLDDRDTTRPFFMWTSFTKPHPPLDPCANYWSLYQNRTVPSPIFGDWSVAIEDIPQGFMDSSYYLNNVYRMASEQVLDVRRAYYACITQLDYQLGLLFAHMREHNLFDNTWIIFTSDHGEMLGDHHMSGKSIFLEGASHIPLLVRPPAPLGPLPQTAGTRINTLVNLADIMPTVLAAAGLTPADHADGIDLMSLVDNPIDRDFYGVCKHDYAIIRKNMKYTWTHAEGGELLFDLDADPMEQHNLAELPEHQSIRTELRAALIERAQQHNSPLVQNGELVSGPAQPAPQATSKWPGFHAAYDRRLDTLH